MRKSFILYCIFTMICTAACRLYAQPQPFVTLKWEDYPVTRMENFEEVTRDYFFEGAEFNDSGLPVCVQSIDIGRNCASAQYDITLEFPEYEPVSFWQNKRLTEERRNLPAAPQPEWHMEIASKEGFIAVRFVPLVFRDGRYQRIKSFRLRLDRRAAKYAPQEETERYAESSVLAEGRWHKVAVGENTGIYTITKEELAKMGFNDISKVAVFGYGGEMLQEDFSLYKPDDLPEVPVWRDSDKIKFFAKGTVRYDFNSSGYLVHTQNYSSDYGYYFITEKDSPAQFATAEAVAPATEATTVVKDIAVYEKDDNFKWENYGRRYYETYSYYSNPAKTYQLELPGITGNKARVTFGFSMAISTSTDSKVKATANGEELGTSTSFRINSVSQYMKAVYRETSLTWSDNLNENLDLTLSVERNSPIDGHLDYIEVCYDRKLEMQGDYLLFRNKQDGATTYAIGNAGPNTVIMDVTNPGQYEMMPCETSNGTATFTSGEQGSRTFMAVNPEAAFNNKVTDIGEVANQNLHALKDVDMVIIIPASGKLYAQAERIAQEHRDTKGLNVVTVNAGDIYNEFSSGTPDPTAYRWFMKMFYDRAGESDNYAKYLLLFGDCAYDNKLKIQEWSNFKQNDFLLYHQPKSNASDDIDNLMTDDYFAYLDDNEGANLSRASVDIGVGRITVRNETEAKEFVDKQLAYMRNENPGIWKNKMLFVADDNIDAGDSGHMTETNKAINALEKKSSSYMMERIFLDTYKIETTSTGKTYPEARKRLLEALDEGALVLDYTGHSGTYVWTQKKLFTSSDVQSLTSPRLALWVTSSCDYVRPDDMARAAGELALINPKGGAIALMSTSRAVNIEYDGGYNLCFMKRLLDKDESGAHLTLGDIYMQSKQERQKQGGGKNLMCYVLLGDPALTLAYPDENEIVLDSIDGGIDNGTTQIRAGDKITISGHIKKDGVRNDSFNGIITTTVFDSEELVTTLNNGNKFHGEEPDTIKYLARTKKLFLGNDSIRNGQFSMTFPVPKDINYSDGYGLMNFYALAGKEEGQGSYGDFIVGGSNDQMQTDSLGPKIFMYLNEPDFEYGGKTHPTPMLYAIIEDEDGINISGNGIGHDLVAIVDDNSNQMYILNNYYTSEIGDYTKGNVAYLMPELTEGKHKVMMRAWDVQNNSSTAILEFEVVKGLKPNITDVTCTSPAINETTFIVTHDRAGSDITVTIQVFDMTGRILWANTERQTASSPYYQLTWDLRGNGGQPIGKGIYLYKASVSSGGGKEDTMTKKMVILPQ